MKRFVFFTTLLVAAANYYVPVSVMLPLNAVTNNNQLNNPTQLTQWFQQLKSCNVNGIMTDVWWGLVEGSAPQQYDWSAYLQLAQIAEQVGLQLQVVMSFHQCGGNVGDECDITLPQWVLSVGESNPDIFYTDSQGHRDQEYLSLGIDQQALFQGRTPVQIYSDYMNSFAQTFESYLGTVITQVQIGLGPAGEMRYPSYQLAYWTFPGIGEFQFYDKYMMASLKQAAIAYGQPSWASGPNNTGTYDSTPSQTGFFGNGANNYASPFGQWFLTWYANMLIDHGEAILSEAHQIFSPFNNVSLAAKIAGIHWLYFTPSHAAELTAGYKNDQGNGYMPIAQMLAKYNIRFDFTCLEMLDSNQPSNCYCGPEELVAQTESNAKQAGIDYQGENALQVYDTNSYQTIEWEATRDIIISAFTYLRLTTDLLSQPNWGTFCTFVQNMHTLI